MKSSTCRRIICRWCFAATDRRHTRLKTHPCHQHLRRAPFLRCAARLSPARGHLPVRARGDIHAKRHHRARDRNRKRAPARPRRLFHERNCGADRPGLVITACKRERCEKRGAPVTLGNRKPTLSASAWGDRFGSRRSRVGSCGRASLLRRISPAAGRGGTWNPQARHRAPA